VAIDASGNPVPETVTVNDLKTVRYGEIYTELIGAVQAMSREFDALHIQLSTMEGMRRDLALKVRELEARCGNDDDESE